MLVPRRYEKERGAERCRFVAAGLLRAFTLVGYVLPQRCLAAPPTPWDARYQPWQHPWQRANNSFGLKFALVQICSDTPLVSSAGAAPQVSNPRCPFIARDIWFMCRCPGRAGVSASSELCNIPGIIPAYAISGNFPCNLYTWAGRMLSRAHF